MSTIKISDGILTAFYNQNPDFDILQFNLSDQSALSQLNWNGLDRPTILELLKKYQRLLRLHPDPAIATALLNPSPQPATASPAPQAATLMAVANPSPQPVAATNPPSQPAQPSLDSAHAIAAIPEAQFVQTFGPSVGGAAVAKQIHQNATDTTAKTALLWANVQNLVAAPHFRTTRANNVGDDIHQFENFPNYQDLFGSLDFCECDQCQSIFSPAAYFVDLMRLTEEKITGNPNNKIKTDKTDFTLNARRPDLAQIPLTCAATNDQVPYLDIVNKVVALKVNHLLNNSIPTTPEAENQAIDRAYYTLATATYPWTLPFNLPLEQIRHYLGFLKTDLATIYQTFNTVETAQVSVARETLGLSVEEYTLITTPRTTDNDLTAIYGVNVSGNSLGGLTNLDTFLQQTGLSRQELHDLFYQNLSQVELAHGLAYNFYINQTPLLSQPQLMGYWPLNEGTGTSISDSVSSSKNTGIVHGASWQTAVDFLEGSRSVLQFNGTDNYVSLPDVNFDYSKGFTIEAWVYYNEFKKWSRIIDFGNGAANQNIILANDGTSGTLAFVVYSEGKATQLEAPNALQTNTWIHLAVTVDASGGIKLYKNGQEIQSGSVQIPQNTNRTKNYIGKSNWDSDDYFHGRIANVRIWNRSLSVDEVQAHSSNSYSDLDRTLKNLNFPTLDRIHRFVRLAKKLNWSFADLDWVLTSIKVTGTKDIDQDAIQQIAKIKQLQATTNLPLDILCSFWHDLKAIGIGDGQSSQARFDIVFNNPQLLGGKSPYRPRPTNPENSSANLGNLLYTSKALELSSATNKPDTNTQTNNSNPYSKIAAGLRISLNDLTALLQAFWGANNTNSDSVTIDLTVQNLSILYRHTLLAVLLRLPIDQYLILLRLATQKAPKESLFLAIDTLVSVLENGVWLMASGFNVYELDYILNGTDSQFVDKKYKNEDIQPFLHTLQTLNTAQPGQQVSDDDRKEKLIEQLAIFLGSTTDIIEAFLNIASKHLTLPTGVDSYTKVFFTPVSLINLEDDKDLNAKPIKEIIGDLSKGLVLNQKTQLTPTEINSVFSHPACYGITSDSQQANLDNIKSLDNIRSLYTFKQLTKAFDDTQDNLVRYFAQFSNLAQFSNHQLSDAEKSAAQTELANAQAELAKVTGWDKTQIKELVENHFLNDFSLYSSVAGITKLKRAFDLSQSLGVNISFHEGLVVLATKTITTDADWQSYNNAAQAMAEIVKAKHNDGDWATVSAKINGTLNELKRTALTGFALWKLGQQDSSLNNLRTLSEYLLIDVETTGCASISYIKQAILSVQMYLQRCRIHLEPGVTQVEIPDIWWEWMMNYRVWEANRKVFLYPENYIEPNLRKNKTDLFQELESELLQSDITQEAVEAAYHNYFDKLAELAKLRIASTYRYFVPQPDGSKQDTLFVFGKTATEPHSYYYRECLNPTANPPTWTPWSKIDVGINSEYISPAFAFNKLFVFWVEITQNTSSISGNNSKTTVKKATIKYSFQTVSRKWMQPQTLSKDIIINVDPNTYPLPGIDLDTEKLFWKKVYPLTIREQNSEPEKILVVFGNIPILPTEPNSLPTQAQDKDVQAFNQQINHSLDQNNQASSKGNHGYTSLIPAATLTSDLVIENNKFLILGDNARQIIYAATKSSDGILAAIRIKNILSANYVDNIVDLAAADAAKAAADAAKAAADAAKAATDAAAKAADSSFFNSNFNDSKKLLSDAADVTQKVADATQKAADATREATAVTDTSAKAAADAADAAAKTAQSASTAAKEATAKLNPNDFNAANQISVALATNANAAADAADAAAKAANAAAYISLAKSPQNNSSVLTVKNQPGWFTFDNGDEAFLVIPQELTASPISDSLDFQTDSPETIKLSYTGSSGAIISRFAFIRLTSSIVQSLSQKAFIGGIDHLLTLESQQTPELDFSRFNPSSAVTPPASKTLDFKGSYGLYFQEIFFHIPFLIANTLNTNQRFAEAQKWYHYIFNPTQPQPMNQGLVGYWPLNEESGTTVNDKTGRNNGTVQGNPQWSKATDFPGGDRSVLQFDGSTFVQISDPFVNVVNFTIQLWVKPLVLNNGNSYGLIGRPGKPSMQLAPSDGGLRYDSFSDSGVGFSDVLANFFTSTKEWVHITWVRDGQQYSFYRNGQLFATRPAPQKISTNPDRNYSWIGKVNNNWQGQISEVRFWNVALSAEQVLEKFENASPNLSDRFWRYLPFQGNTLEKLTKILTNDDAITAYNNDPFDPHAIAQLRIGAYEKAIVMKYIDNLLDWGDSLFTQDTWESITQATMLYLLAYDLLGQKPENLGNCKLPKPETFQDIKAQYDHNQKSIPPFLIELEQLVANSSSSTLARTPFNDINTYFCVSENEQFTAYWNRVEDRLYKIRHCQNIQGVARQLALFEPPIDPNQLVRAVAAGNVPISVMSGLTAQVPHYRFDYMLERAKNMTSTVIQLGSSLLSALEKKDAEQLSLLRASQESAILRLIQATKEKQIAEAQANLNSLNKSLDAANNRVAYYQNLINSKWNAAEISSVTLAGVAIFLEADATVFNALAAPVYLAPNIFGLADGGSQPASAVASVAAALSGSASVLNQGSYLAATIAQYQRREEEWQFQLQMTQDDVALIAQQINAAQITVDIATAELTAHQKNIEQANEVEDFLKHKFSTQDLYQWMVDRLSVLYFQTFKIALDMALAAQTAYQYELNKDDTYINFDYWDSLKKGLLAGEGLMLGLNQLEKSYLEGNERRLEIEKTISLKDLNNGLALNDLKATEEKCRFELNEELFDRDFPGHYCRQIKTISISIPAVIGPYQNIKATLTQLSDKTLLKPDANGVKYLLGDMQNTSQPDASIIRSSWRRNQKIALSRGINDTGLFELNFRDERYLPFEGTGAISTWELSLPKDISLPKDTNQIGFDNLTDVIITLSYTALDAGDTFKQTVQSVLKSL